MNRSQSVFELFPKTLNELKQNLEYEGSDLAGINAEFAFKEIPKVSLKLSWKNFRTSTIDVIIECHFIPFAVIHQKFHRFQDNQCTNTIKAHG